MFIIHPTDWSGRDKLAILFLASSLDDLSCIAIQTAIRSKSIRKSSTDQDDQPIFRTPLYRTNESREPVEVKLPPARVYRFAP